MIIEKLQKNPNLFVFKWSYFSSAREGLKQILVQPQLAGKKILLPAYIGYSTREGSGVFDPIVAARTPYIFYPMDASLYIDMPALKRMIEKHPGHILLLIHYFGFKDKNIDIIKNLARKYKMVLIEDFAHALHTFYNDPRQDFDYAIFSLHKLLPQSDGGMVLSDRWIKGRQVTSEYDMFRYNLPLIAQQRTENYTCILKALRGKARNNSFHVLRPVLGGHVPQTFPILLQNQEIRDQVYFAMNKAGYGMVSLYHQLIVQIDKSFNFEHGISNTILNLPVHQDTAPLQLEGMLKIFFKLLKKD